MGSEWYESGKRVRLKTVVMQEGSLENTFGTRIDAWNNKWEKKGGVHPAVYSGEDSEFLVQVCTTMRSENDFSRLPSCKDVGCRSNFDPSRPFYTQDTSFSVKSSLTAFR